MISKRLRLAVQSLHTELLKETSALNSQVVGDTQLIKDVSDWQVRQEVRKLIESLRGIITKDSQVYHVDTEIEKGLYYRNLEESLEKLEDELVDCIKRELISFVRKV